MANYKVERYVVGPVMTNCYFLVNTDTKEIVIIDPGEKGEFLAGEIDKNGYRPIAILLTHGHFDHILAVNYLKDKFDLFIGAYCDEANMLANPKVNMTHMGSKEQKVLPDDLYKDNDIISAAGFKIKVMHTPGHSAGSVCYYIEDIKVLFSGDTLFCGSVGRTDLPTGNSNDILSSVNDVLMKLPDDVVVYTGHDIGTTIGDERKNNPYVK